MARRRRTPGSDGSVERLAHLADELDLTTLDVGRWAQLLAEAQDRAISFTDFATRVLQVEHDARQTRKRERAHKRSRLGITAGLDGFDWSVRPNLQPSVVMELLRCEWVRLARRLLLVGAQGTGKTHLAKAIGSAAVDAGFTVRYVAHTADMLDELRGARVDRTYQRVFRRLAQVDVLICDELGYQALDDANTNDLFRLVAARQSKATVVVSNTGFKHWHRFFPSKAQAVATVDRLIDDATILRFSGKSFRKPRDIHGDPLDGDDELPAPSA
jgi:DNA replication protein DnaC